MFARNAVCLKLATIGGVLVTLISGCSEKAPVSVELQPRPARIVEVKAFERERVFSFVGNVQAPQTIDFAFEIDGRIASLPLREGDIVSKGSLLAKLDSEEFELRLGETQAELALSEQDLDRLISLVEGNLVAQSQLDQAATRRDLLRLRMLQAQKRLKDTALTAPMDLRIVRRYVDNHSAVEANQSILRAVPITPLDIVAAVPDELVATISEDQVIDINAEFDVDDARSWPLRVREYVAEASSETQTYAVRFELLESPSWNLLPGMTAKVVLRVRSAGPELLTIPASAVQSDTSGDFFVWAVADNEFVQQKYVKVGPPIDDEIVITDGLAVGERIVAAGAFALQSGMRVRPMSGDR